MAFWILRFLLCIIYSQLLLSFDNELKDYIEKKLIYEILPKTESEFVAYELIKFKEIYPNMSENTKTSSEYFEKNPNLSNNILHLFHHYFADFLKLVTKFTKFLVKSIYTVYFF